MTTTAGTATAATGTATDGSPPGRHADGSGAPRVARPAALASADVLAGQDDASSVRGGAGAVPEQRPGEAARPAAPPDAVAPRGSSLPQQRHPLDPPPRPRIVQEPAILGLSRLTRGRFGSRLFALFFVLVYALIVVQTIYAIFDRPW